MFPYIVPKSCVIPNGIEPLIERERSIESRQTIRSTLGLGDSLTFIFAGRVSSAKGVPNLLHAFSQLQFEHKNLSLLILGEGPDMLYLASKHRNVTGIHFLGYREDVGSYYRAADVAIIPSMREGMSTFVLEAMFHNLPIISTKVGGIQDLLEKGAAIEILGSAETHDIGLTLDKFVAMTPKERESMGAVNRCVVMKDFLWQSLSSRTVSVYESVLDEM